MTNEELKIKISTILPAAGYEEGGEFLNVLIHGSELLSLMNVLKHDPELDFDYLFCETCVDWKTHFVMTYHLLSKKLTHCVVVKAKIEDTNHPQIESVNHLWKTAELNEDEIYDLFGINFIHHPNLRRLFLEEDWKGHPLRKNYTDENMIKL